MTSRSRISAKLPLNGLLPSLSLPYIAHEGLSQHTLFGVDLDHSHTLTRQDRYAWASRREHHYKVTETTIIDVFVQSKDALKTNTIASTGRKPKQDFLLRYLLSACCTHQRIHPRFYKKRAKRGKGGSPRGQCKANGPAGRARWICSSPSSHGAGSIPQALLTMRESNWHPKGQATAQTGRHLRSFPRGMLLGSPWEGLVLHGAALANSSAWVMERGQWEIRGFIQWDFVWWDLWLRVGKIHGSYQSELCLSQTEEKGCWMQGEKKEKRENT